MDKTEFCKGPFDSQVGGSHYQYEDGLPGPAEWCMRQNMGAGEAAAIKYLARHDKKAGLEDIKKAYQYVEFIAWVKYGVDLREGKGFASFVEDQKAWSIKNFGPYQNTESLIDHIKKELKEIQAKPTDLEEWIDVIILAMDGAWRTGAKPLEIEKMLKYKQEKNRKRTWPDWETAEPGKAIEHLKDGQPCEHPGCLSHISHPCEGCGRIAGEGVTNV